MKKMILAAILATVSAVSMAEGTNGHFTGFGVGAELGAEYQHARLSNSDFDGHLKTNSFNVGAAIRF